MAIAMVSKVMRRMDRRSASPMRGNRPKTGQGQSRIPAVPYQMRQKVAGFAMDRWNYSFELKKSDAQADRA